MALLVGALSGTVTPAHAALTPADASALTQALTTMSAGFDQDASATAHSILGNSQYVAADWQAFFDQYLNATTHPYTDALHGFLLGEIFFAFTPAIQLNLQLGIDTPLWTRATAIVTAHPSDLGPFLFANTPERQTVFNAHRFYALLARWGVVDTTARTTVYDRYRAHIQAVPQWFTAPPTHNPLLQPVVAALRAQVWTSLGETLPVTPARDAEIAATIGITGRRLDIWTDAGMLVIDNNGLDAAQLDALYAMKTSVPAPLSTPRYMTVVAFFQSSLLRPLIVKGQSGGSLNYALTVDDRARAIFFFDGVSGGTPTVISTTSLASDAWNHVAATYDGGTLRMYINGVAAGAVVAPGAPVSTSTVPLRIGRFVDSGTWMKGSLDEVKIWSRALSASEIQNEAAGTPVGTGVVAHYRMDETSGTTVADASGLGNNATAIGATPNPGRFGNGRLFDGLNDYVEAPDTTSLRRNGAMTVQAWVYVINEGVFVTPGAHGAVNIFGFTIPSHTENSFPPDIAPGFISTFCAAAAHEINHVVNAFDIAAVPARAERHDDLIAQAGTVHDQYLRSNILDGTNNAFFVNAPGEFFASIANQYFTDSWHTLALGLQRFDAGFHEPLNQFLFFADIYAAGTLTTRAYTVGTTCALTSANVPIGRDTLGHVVRITNGATTYYFDVDASGNALAYTTTPPDLTVTSVSGPASATAGQAISVANTVRNLGPGVAAPSTVSLYLSTDQTITASDTLLGSRAVGSLAAGASSSGTTSVTVPAAANGTYYLGAIADSGDAVTEQNEGNNATAAASTTTVAGILPDLVFTAFSASINGNREVAIANTFKNQGVVATSSPFNTNFYLSFDQTLGAGDVFIGTRFRSNALGVGSSDSATTRLGVPAGTAPGNYFVLGFTDNNNGVAEINESNNTTSTATTLTIRPDLIGGGVSADVSGTMLLVNDTIENDGPLATAGTFRIDYYLSTDTVITTSDVFLGSRNVTTSVAANDTNAGNATLAIPQTLTPGNYRVGIIIDATGVVTELDETNNTDSSGAVELRPDLVAVSLTASASGRNVTFNDSIRNDGSLPALAPFTIDLRLSDDNKVGTSDPLLGRRTISTNLAPGNTSTGNTVLTAPAGTVPAGNYYGALWADGVQAMTELSENNNKLTTTGTFFVGP